MQDRKSPVFVAATCNNVTVLPPELIRKGRFDELFFVDLPNQSERKQIFSIQLAKRKRNPAEFDLDQVAAAAKGLKPNLTQCIGFSVPLVLRSSPTSPNNPYVVDLYEHLAFLGDINQQIATMPDGAKVRLLIREKPE